MKIKNIQIINTIPVLSKINETNLDIITAMKMIKISEPIEQENLLIEKGRKKLLDKYAQKDDKGNILSDDEGKAIFEEGKEIAFREDLAKLYNIETEVKTSKLSISDLAGVRIAPKELAVIQYLIEDE